MPELGTIESVDVREIWPNEAHDFTPWLIEHLSILGKALELDLEPIQREAPVGDFSLDILARDRNTDEVIAIENQLEWTDHTHLGQILTYAAGHDARTVIWVTPKFREEHRATIDWLNRWTPEEIAFFGVEVGAIKIGNSLPAPEFRPVAFPNDWAKHAKQRVSTTLEPRREKLRQFFTTVSQQLRKDGFADQVYKYQGVPRFFPSSFSEISYSADVGTHVRAYIWINMGNGRRKHRFFDALQEYTGELANNLDAEWFWHPYGNYGYAACGIQTEGSIDDSPEKVKEHEAWILEHLPRLKSVLTPYLEKIMSDLQSEEPAPIEE